MEKSFMSRLSFLIIPVACMISFSGVVHAKSRTITILGPVSCVDWVKGREEDKAIEPGKFKFTSMRTEAWLLGVVSGLNSGLPGPDLLASVNAHLVFDWMDGFCARNPKSDLYDGAVDLLKDISKTRRK